MPKRWVVEGTHAWNEQARRLIMHHHRLFDVSAARVWLAEARMLARRLTTRFCLQPLTDALAKAGTMRQQIVLRGQLGLQPAFNDFNGWLRQWHDVEWYFFTLPTLAHLQLLDHFRRDHPQPALKVELLRRGGTQLAGTYTRQKQQTDAQHCVGVTTIRPQGVQKRREFVHPQMWLVPNLGLGQRHDIEISGRVRRLPLLDHCIAKLLVEPGPTFFCRRHRPAPLDLAQHFQHMLT